MRSFRGYGAHRRTSPDIAPDQMRRLADLLIAGVLLGLTSPLMFFAALAIKWEGPGPIFERQRCIARRGRRFDMLKFRTMVPDPERTMPGVGPQDDSGRQIPSHHPYRMPAAIHQCASR